MQEERIQKLNKIGFEWSFCHLWDETFEELKAFQREHGHCRVPGVKEKDVARNKLAEWVARQRVEYRLLLQGKKLRMKEERIQKLNEIGLEWSVIAGDWDEKLEQLKAFQREHGHYHDPGVKEKDSATHLLVWWVSKQWTQYKLFQQGKKSQITQERIQKLNGVGFAWFAHLLRRNP
jgi:hypothetical protein